jgi:hypothetical protein
MKRPRKRFLALALTVIILLFLGLKQYRSPAFKEAVKKSVESEISRLVGGDVTVDDIRLGLLSVTVSGINLTIPLNAVKLNIDRLRIGFSLSALIKKKWEPQELVDRVAIIRPTISFSPFGFEQSSSKKIPLPQELSEQIVNNFYSRKIEIRDCQLSLLTPSQKEVVSFSGLDGVVAKEGNAIKFSLDGSHKSLLDNIFIDGIITPEIEKERISFQLKDVAVEIKDSINQLTLKTKLSTTLEVNFKNLPYPQSISPSGFLKFEETNIKQNEVDLVTNGEISLFAADGIYWSDNISLPLKDGEIIGYLDAEDSDSSSLNLEAVSSLGTAEFIIKTASFRDSSATFRLTANSAPQKPEFSFIGEGLVNSRGVKLKRYRADLKGVKSRGAGKLNYSGRYLFKNSAEIKVNSNNIEVLGSAKSSIAGIIGENEPLISSKISNLKVKSKEKSLSLPTLYFNSSSKGVTLKGQSETIEINGQSPKLSSIRNDSKLSLSIKKEKIEQFLSLLGVKNNKLKRGALSFSLESKDEKLSFNYGATMHSKIGEIGLFGTGEFSKKREVISIDKLEFKRGGVEIPFTLSLKKKQKDWQIKAENRDKTIRLKAQLNSDFSYIKSAKLTLNSLPAALLNALFEEEQMPIRDGQLFGEVVASGKVDNIKAKGNLSLSQALFGEMSGLNTSISGSWSKDKLFIRPFTLYARDSVAVLSVQKCIITEKEQNLKGKIKDFDISTLPIIGGTHGISGLITGSFYTKESILNLKFHLPNLYKGKAVLSGVRGRVHIDKNRAVIDSFTFTHNKLHGLLSLSAPLNQKRGDSLTFSLKATGDILASLGQFEETAIGGNSSGEIDISGAISDGELFLNSSRVIVSNGELSVFPFVQGYVENFYGDIKIDNEKKISLNLRGTLDKQKLVIKNRYDYHKSLTPFEFGGVDLGVLEVFTEKGGVPLFMPGFLENRRGNTINMETGGKDDIPNFTLSGPFDEFKLTGTLKLKKGEFTFPLLDDVIYPVEMNVFPYISWDLDIYTADNSVSYFYRLGRKKKRRAIKVIECTIDPSATIGIRGREEDGTFQVVGAVNSYRGALFYGKMFRQNFSLGLDFQSEPKAGGGYDNTPFVWGYAEAPNDFDTTGFSKVSVTVMTRNRETKEFEKRGRFTELSIVPSSESDSTQVGSGEDEAAFFKDRGEAISDPNKAGELLGGVGDRYLSSYLFNYWGTQLVRHMGLDIMRVETSFMSNYSSYFLERQSNSGYNPNASRLAFANSGITLGKYLFRDNVLLKVGTSLMAQDTSLVPTYKLGFEYQPLRYLWMDFNYGVTPGGVDNLGIEQKAVSNPAVQLQLRVPLSDFKNMFKK